MQGIGGQWLPFHTGAFPAVQSLHARARYQECVKKPRFSGAFLFSVPFPSPARWVLVSIRSAKSLDQRCCPTDSWLSWNR
jgi:hypothetical protein